MLYNINEPEYLSYKNYLLNKEYCPYYDPQEVKNRLISSCYKLKNNEITRLIYLINNYLRSLMRYILYKEEQSYIKHTEIATLFYQIEDKKEDILNNINECDLKWIYNNARNSELVYFDLRDKNINNKINEDIPEEYEKIPKWFNIRDILNTDEDHRYSIYLDCIRKYAYTYDIRREFFKENDKK